MTDKSIQAHARRAWLINRLGGLCVSCGKKDDLQFDHVHNDGFLDRTLGFCDRMRRYLTLHRLGRLQLLCGSCNRKKAARLRLLKRCGVRVIE